MWPKRGWPRSGLSQFLSHSLGQTENARCNLCFRSGLRRAFFKEAERTGFGLGRIATHYMQIICALNAMAALGLWIVTSSHHQSSTLMVIQGD